MQTSILLLSSSNVHGYGYLQCNKDAIQEFVAGLTTPLLFVPYAADKNEWDAYTNKVGDFFKTIGIEVKGIHKVPREQMFTDYEAVFVGGGNTFRLLHTMQEQQLLPGIQEAVMSGKMKYMGSSAGSNLACKTICTTNDMPIVYPKEGFDALNLFPCQINAHYLDPEPESKHKGETREQRIKEFHEMNDTPVVGLREGAYLALGTDFPKTREVLVGGINGARIFKKGQGSFEAVLGKVFKIV
jgi:dipeptidase E